LKRILGRIAARTSGRSAGRTAYLLALLALQAPADAAPESQPQPQQAAPQELPDVVVIGTSPVPGTGVPVEFFPGNAQTLSARAIAPGSAALSDTLAGAVGSVTINDTQGNPLQSDLNYRGYTASPVLGTPQGISVFVDGTRVNEPFGDVVAWDLIPQIAIANVTVIPGTNPVYGRNTLGGALAVNTKSGFAYPGAALSLGAGSFARRSMEVEFGGHQEHTDYFLAGSTFDERGWARFNPSRVRQAFAKAGYQDSATDLDLSLQYVDDSLSGSQLVAQSMAADAAQGYSHPDVTATRNVAGNLTGRRQLDAARSVEGNVYYRNIWRQILNSNINDPVVAGSADQAAACLAAYAEPCAGNTRSQYRQDIVGLNLQYSNQAPLLGRKQYFSAGFNGERGAVAFTQTLQPAIVDATYAVLGIDAFAPQSDIGSRSLDGGLYATDTLVLDARWSLTLSARFDRSLIDLAGTSVDGQGNPVGVTGNHAYQHLNPALGGTFTLSTALTAFANYAEGFRTPSAIELACADPAHPCAGVPNAFSSDPNLQAIRARSAELGARGSWGAGLPGATLQWRFAGFSSNLENDILFNQSTLTTGYFSNVGRTRRRGVEASLDAKSAPFDVALSAAALDATYQGTFTVANAANTGSVCPGSLCVPVHSGDRIPGIPQRSMKLALGYQVSAATHLDALFTAQGASFARGDENNLATHGRIAGYGTLKAGFTHRINETLDVYGSLTNVLDRVYANFGMLSSNNLKGGSAENFLALAAPRTAFIGLRAGW
jgi:iron complex outermembrane receptor protein